MPEDDSLTQGETMADVKQNQQAKPQSATGGQHPQEYRQDLNPNAMAGQNIGAAGPHSEKGARSARDVKDLHARYRDWSDADLEQIPVVPEGTRLEQDATYLDLSVAAPREFTATGDMTAQRHNRYVPKSEVPYEIWNRLLGIKNVMRTGVSE
jgi:hypothetical protein